MSEGELTPRGGGALDARRVLIIVAVILLVWFAIANSESVRVGFWVVSTSAPMFLVIVIAAVLGGVVGWFLRGRRRPRGS